MNAPFRSLLYVPALRERAVEKARALPCDGVILDLEDSIAPGDKDDARARALAEIERGGFGGRHLLIRINAPGTRDGDEDIAALARSPMLAAVHGVVVPKAESAADIETVRARLPALAPFAMIETPRAVLSLSIIAAACATHRLGGGLVLGSNDLLKTMGARDSTGREAITAVMTQLVLAARAFDLLPIDGVLNDFRDEASLAAQCQQARLHGFVGKSLIHPAQINAANAAFSPGEDEITRARAIIAAFEAADSEGVTTLDGEMIEALHRDEARQTLAFARACGITL